ncbi:MAG: ASCH domain-containing protein [bacterium]|nr:ASCH domain-containing protein [bacterium]
MSGRPLTAFWDEARIVLGLPPDATVPDAWAFGDSAEMADELLALVLIGRKRATTGMLWEYEEEVEPLAAPGELSILLDGNGSPACVVETTEVRILPMSQVDSQFAFDEGEGDRSLESWWRAHEEVFGRVLEAAGRNFDPDMLVVTERLALRYVPA